MQRVLGTHGVVGAGGRRLRIVETAGPAAAGGGGERGFRTADSGQVVERVERGVYRVRRTGEVLRATHPGAP